MAHVNELLIRDMMRSAKTRIKSTTRDETVSCNTCVEVRKTRKTSSRESSWRNAKCNNPCICTWITPHSIVYESYFLTMMALQQRFMSIYSRWSRVEIEGHCSSFIKWIERIRIDRLKLFRSDNCAEFLALRNQFMKVGLEFRTSTPYNPQFNGVADRMSTTLLGKTKSILNEAGIKPHISSRGYSPGGSLIKFYKQFDFEYENSSRSSVSSAHWATGEYKLLDTQPFLIVTNRIKHIAWFSIPTN